MKHCQLPMNTHELPPELWLLIFDIALLPNNDFSVDEYEAFQPSPTQRNAQHHEDALQLALVCYTWHSLLLPTLCKDIKLCGRQIPLPQHVRRVVLPYTTTTMVIHPHNPSAVVEQLQRFIQIETLCRPAALAIGKPLPGPPAIALPSLRRLEWCHLPHLDHSGGINSLLDVLSQCPSIRYLFVSGLTHQTPLLDTQRDTHVPTLETLRLRYSNDDFLQILCRWSLPRLKAVIFDIPLTWSHYYTSSFSDFWIKFGRNLVRVELGKDIGFRTGDYLTNCLRGCPALQDLGFYVFFTACPSRVLQPIRHRSLRRVHLHAAPYGFLNTQETWSALREHMAALNHPGMERLTTFHKHGEWDALVHDPQWSAIEDGVTAQGREFV